MADGLRLINEMNDLQRRLNEGIKLMGKYGREYAQAECDYKIALSQEALKLRAEDMPVTLIDKVVYGKVADQRFKRDTAEVLWKTAQENVNSLKLRMRILDNQIAREWGNVNG